MKIGRIGKQTGLCCTLFLHLPFIWARFKKVQEVFCYIYSVSQ
jgi:hypothetical protein